MRLLAIMITTIVAVWLSSCTLQGNQGNQGNQPQLEIQQAEQQPENNGGDVAETIKEERYIVVFKRKADQNLIKKSGGKVIKQVRKKPITVTTLSREAKKELQKNPSVDYIEKDQKIRLLAELKDWGIANTRSELAWENRYRGAGVKIAVLDTGIEEQHEDLRVAGGVSFVTEENGDTSYLDYNGHGTHVAGVIGAQHNGLGTMGVAPGSEIYGVKILNAVGDGYLSDLVAGIEWAIEHDMDIINLSLGLDTYSRILEETINGAYEAGMLIVAAAGNEGNVRGTGDTIAYPARFQNVIAVGATTAQNRRASFSSTGPTLEISAPGQDILSTYINGAYAQLSGTSMAAPYVTGIIALLKEWNPDWTKESIRQYVQQSALDLGAVGVDPLYGYGLVQYTVPFSDEENRTIDTLDPPTLERSLTAEEAITLQWNVVKHAEEYSVTRDGEFKYQGTETTYIDREISPDERYTYHIRAITKEIVSEPLEIEVVTKVRRPSIQLEESRDREVHLFWTPLPEAQEYLLKRNGQEIYRGQENSYLDRELLSNTSYRYELSARGKTGWSDPASTTLTTQIFVPKPPPSLQGIASEGRITLHWSKPDDRSVIGYYLYINGDRYLEDVVTTNTIEIPNLTNGKTYSFSVTAVNHEGYESEPAIELLLRPRVPVSFQDISVKHWAYDQAMEIGERGWMTGTAPSMFSPNLGLTRAEAAVILVRALQLKALEGVKVSFQDVSEQHWARKEIEIIAQHNIMTGKTTQRFAPKDLITREQMAVILYRLFLTNKPVAEESPFTDVSPRHWAYEAIRATTYYGIFVGNMDGTFRPKETLKRIQMAVLMARISPYFF